MSSWNPSAQLRALVSRLLNQVLAPYVENLNTDQLNFSLWNGEVQLDQLRLKKSALDKFKLPVDVIEGHLGSLRLSIPYTSLGKNPVRLEISDVYLLATPSADNKSEPGEREKRDYELKLERLKNAEALDLKGSLSDPSATTAEQQKNAGTIATMVSNIVNNIQINVKNIHIRYEDKLSTPEHPFAIGVTLAKFSALSTDENWVEAFISDAKKALHKIGQLESLAIYFDTDAPSISDPQSRENTMKNFEGLIARKEGTEKQLALVKSHQFILKPVTGEGRLIINHKVDKETPQFDTQVLFDEFGFVIDDDQYRDALSMVDLFHFYTRTQQYQAYRLPDSEYKENAARARLKFALTAIKNEVHEKHRKWTWDYFRERRDDRKNYVELYMKLKKAKDGKLVQTDQKSYEDLEKKLEYADIRFYRSIAKSELRKDAETKRNLEEEKKAAQPATTSWVGWAWGGATKGSKENSEESMTEADRQGLLSLVGYDPKAEAPSFDMPGDALKLRVAAKLRTGSFALRKDPHGADIEIIQVVADAFQADFIQFTEAFDATVTLGGFRIRDGTTKGSVYPQIVRVKDDVSGVTVREDLVDLSAEQQAEEVAEETDVTNPFFSVRFEQNPLDGRADNGVTVKMRHLEIVYHKGYVEEIVRFFKPPASQLESINALINVASETFEGIRKETRAGLEFALQQHKTIDIKLDMNAPIIIIPEDITTRNCPHLVLDAGHIAMESNLVAKEALATIQAKKDLAYTEEDFKQLENLMYDQFTVRLESAQLLLSHDLTSCLAALSSDHMGEEVHILERINMSFQVQNSILNAPNITRFKISGELPTLQVNFSDAKYKSLMRFIDVTIPKFGDSEETPASSAGAAVDAPPEYTRPSPFSLRSSAAQVQEYNLEETNSVIDEPADPDEKFFEAPEPTEDLAEVHQRIFEFKFNVNKLQASLFKSQLDRPDLPFADAVLEGFGLEFALKKFDMSVDVFLKSVSFAMIQDGKPGKPLVSSDHVGDHHSHSHDLVRVKYARVQKESPEFMTIYEGVTQTIGIELSTFNFLVTPVPILSLFDFIMTTFVPNKPLEEEEEEPSPQVDDTKDVEPGPSYDDSANIEKIRVRVKLHQARVGLNDGVNQLATLSMAAGEVSVLIRGPSMRVGATLGHLSVTDDSSSAVKELSFKKLLSVEGDDVVDFSYETFDANDHATFPGYNSSVYLRTGSLKFTFDEEPIRDLYQFAILFARLRPLYDSTSQAAAQRASEIQTQRMHFDVVVKTPIIIVPRDATNSTDMLVARLGEIVARNTYDGGPLGDNTIVAGLHGVNLSSEMTYSGSEKVVLQIIDDMSITLDILQPGHIDRDFDQTHADTQITGKMTDVKLAVTQSQYCQIMSLVNSIPRIFAAADVDDLTPSPSLPQTPQKLQSVPSTPSSEDSKTVGADLNPELGLYASAADGASVKLFPTLDLTFVMSSIKLELFDSTVTNNESLKERSIAKLALISTRANIKMLSDGAIEAGVMLKDLTLYNTRAGNSKWRDIIPAATHVGDQFMVHYTSSGGKNSSALAIVTIDSPEVVLAPDPLFALLDFVLSAFPKGPTVTTELVPPSADEVVDKPTPTHSSLAYRVEIINSTVLILASDSDSQTQAIRLFVNQLLMSQQGILALTIQKLGMSLCRMDKPQETVSFLDEIDATLSIDSRQTAHHIMTDIELSVQPIIFRASYRDILLITNIVNQAISLTAKAQQTDQPEIITEEPESMVAPGSPLVPKPKHSRVVSTGQSKSHRSSSVSHRRSTSKMLKPTIVVSKEHLKATIEGFQLILIGDLQELPLVHLTTNAIAANIQDWSSDLKFSTGIKSSLKYFNLTNSAWEPLMEPYSFTLRVIKSAAGGEAGKLAVTFNSKERLELNVTSTFIEQAITSYNLWTKESDRILQTSRGGDAPYTIKNKTGYPLQVWADGSKTRSKLADGQEIPWRFEDYKQLREHVGEISHHSLAVQVSGASWEAVKGISVDREGDFTYPLRPRLEKVSHRLVCDVKLIDNVKLVTLRSAMVVVNHTHIPVELILIEADGKPGNQHYKMAPGESCPLPIEAAYHKRFKIRPDPGFDFAWSGESLHWQDLMKRPARAVQCRSHNSRDAPFRFQANVVYDSKDPLTKIYPRMTLVLRSPLEVENLLPFDIKYRVFDKNTSLNTSTFLRKGGISPVHQVELGHLLLMSVQVQDAGLGASEFSIINTDNPDDFSEEKTLEFTDQEGRKLNLNLHYFKYPETNGAVKVQIYSPFIFLNKTGLPFALRSKTWLGQPKDVVGSAQMSVDYQKSEPTPFMFSFPNSDRRNRYLIKVGESQWSKAIPFETLPVDGEVVLDSQSGRSETHVGLSYLEGTGKYALSKVVTIAPRFLLKNELDTTISVREEKSDSFVHLTSGERVPLHNVVKQAGDSMLVIAYQGVNQQWSAPFRITEIGRVHLTLPARDLPSGTMLIRVEVQIDGPTIFINFSKETEPWPFRIQNDTDIDLQFCQSDERPADNLNDAIRTSRQIKNIRGHTAENFTWDRPAELGKRLRLIFEKKDRLIDVMEIGVLEPFRVKDAQGVTKATVSIDVRAEGPSQVVVLSNYEQEFNAFQPKGRGSLSRSSTMDSGMGFEAVQTDTSVNMTISVDFEGIGISLLNKKMQELVYASFRGLKLVYMDTVSTWSADLSCKWIQIDNQLFGGLYPIILYPTVIPKNGKDLESHPTLQTSVTVLKDEEHGVFYIKYASILLQAMSIELDEDFAYALYEFALFKGASWQNVDEDVLIPYPGVIPDPPPTAGGPPAYFESLALQPIQLELSFMRTEHVNAEEAQTNSRNPLFYVFNALTMALGNVNTAPVRLNALMIENVRLSMPSLEQRILIHYKNQFQGQLFRILGSADAFGNPVGLFTNVSSGVHDIFYEPYQGFVLSGNRDLASGIARGATSFVKKTVFGVSDSVSKVTGSIGKGLSAATLDPEFQRQRRAAQRRNKPKHALYGFTAGANAFATSVASGFEGLAMKPIQGAEQSGAGGFFKGVGKGLVGMVTKPVVGVMDFASTASQGIRNTTTVFDGDEMDRVRLPRFVGGDGILRPYSPRDALGQSWMKDLDNGKFFAETYVAHIDLPPSDEVIMLTTRYILNFRSNKLKVSWSVPFWELQTIALEPSGISITLKGGVQGPFIPLPDKQSRTWMFAKVERVVIDYNTSKATDER